MMKSELLAEKDRIQSKLSKESASIHEYLARSHLAAKEIAASYGFRLQYAEMSNKAIHPLRRCAPQRQVMADVSRESQIFCV